MENYFKKNSVTVLVVGATFILAGIAMFTAFRLYQLREGVPGISRAWDCNSYNFTVTQNGAVSVENKSNRNEPSQQAKVYINGNLVATFDAPALPIGQSANLGNVNVPPNKIFNWQVVGTRDCQDVGSYQPKIQSCSPLFFQIATPTGTPTATPTGTPTSTPTGTATPTPPSTPTSTPISSSSTPTTTAIAEASPTGLTLPDSGSSLPTFIGLLAGLVLIIGASLLFL